MLHLSGKAADNLSRYSSKFDLSYCCQLGVGADYCCNEQETYHDNERDVTYIFLSVYLLTLIHR